MVGLFQNDEIIVERNKKKKRVVTHFFKQLPSGKSHQNTNNEDINAISNNVIHRLAFAMGSSPFADFY